MNWWLDARPELSHQTVPEPITGKGLGLLLHQLGLECSELLPLYMAESEGMFIIKLGLKS